MTDIVANTRAETESVDTWLRRMTSAFAAAGLDTPGRDARLLLTHALDLTPNALLRDPGAPVPPAGAARLASYMSRRLAREPVSRIIGRREFWGLSFEVTPDTLDPRPDSETIVAAVLDMVDQSWRREDALRILDVGTGTGCLALSLLSELPNATACLTDISPAALAVARRNALHLGLSARVRAVVARGLAGLRGSFDILVSNPPYIPAGDIATLAPEVRCYDPRLALDGGADGLHIARELAQGLTTLVPNGIAVVELAPQQTHAFAELLEKLGPTAVIADLAGRPRCVAVKTRP